MLDQFDEFILELIFIHLDRRDLITLMTLNKRLLESSERLFWRCTILSKRRDYEVLKLNIKRVSKFIRTLSIPTGSKFKNIEFLLKTSRQMKGLLHLDVKEAHLPRNYFNIITLRCPALRSINLSRTDVTDNCLYLISMNCKNIQKLELLDCNMCSNSGLQYLEYTNITYLSLSSSKFTAALLQSLPTQLKTLKADRIGRIKPSFLHNMPSTLRIIRLSGTYLCDYGISKIFKTCLQLEEFYISRGYEWHPLGYCRQKSLSQEQIEYYLDLIPSLKLIEQD